MSNPIAVPEVDTPVAVEGEVAVPLVAEEAIASDKTLSNQNLSVTLDTDRFLVCLCYFEWLVIQIRMTSCTNQAQDIVTV